MEELTHPHSEIIVGHFLRSCLSEEDRKLIDVLFFGHA